ncbi:GcrA family cell cycle regulator (plasmid) [Microvirga sp. RSM25]|uniref:GcrA family cell cycle regulator n=1 Tax=Microvirga sp. RSM25 TaxID=3273802 RepID=UPI00384C1B11
MPEAEIPEPSPRDRTTLLRLHARQCRFVVSDDGPAALFCGAPTRPESSWCPWHRRLVYMRAPTQGAKAGRGFVLPDYGSAKDRRKDAK